MRAGIRELEAEQRVECCPHSIVMSHRPVLNQIDGGSLFSRDLARALILRWLMFDG